MKRCLTESATRKPRLLSPSVPGSPSLWAGSFTIVAFLTLLWCTMVFSAEKTTNAPSTPPRVPEMSTAGKVIEISGSVLKIERTMKGSVETMEFFLDKPFTGIAMGDQIMVSYREKGGRNILIRVAPAKKTAVQKPKKESPKGANPGESGSAPAKK